MLTAHTRSGKKINLGYNYKKETLLYFRSKEEFFCPICGESVSLKLGDQRIFHFAHKQSSSCREFYENETITHMEGKRQLYQWLIRQRIPSMLEFYDKEIGQRPDILFKFKEQKYALEYQCSSLPESVFIKRTKTYLQNEYHPLWILSSNHIHQKKRDIISLSNFHYLFLRATSSGNLYIPSYCPEKHLFQLVGSITSYSIKNAFAQTSQYPLNDLKIEGLLEPISEHHLNLSSWMSEIENFKLNLTLYPEKIQNPFLNEVYKKNLNLFLLPPEIGLPVPHSLTIQTAPIIWQTYLFLDVLAGKYPNDLITLQEIKAHFNKRIRRKDIIIRNLPQLVQVTPLLAEMEYLQHLVLFGILIRKGDTDFQVQRKITIPRSNREREEAKTLFYRRLTGSKTPTSRLRGNDEEKWGTNCP
ncbi:competence protein CoiA family protein [Neobacillus sp.]|uniref:competence protein CoiA n=1 Tax=Neobacillus sp. TaxID=2675273 RepID=UPI0028999A96|nr:competence protein CoiA family protein [Neobacillus sp.]